MRKEMVIGYCWIWFFLTLCVGCQWAERRPAIPAAATVYLDAEPIVDLPAQCRTNPTAAEQLNDRPYLAIHNAGDQACRVPAEWDVGVYTGYRPPRPWAKYQLAGDARHSGNTACQAYGDIAGFYIESNSTQGHETLRTACYSRNFLTDPVPRPWADGRTLVLRFDRKVPYCRCVGKGVAYTQEYFIIRDCTSNKVFWLGTSSFDSRGTFKEQVIMDDWEKGTHIPIAISAFMKEATFCRPGPGSARSTGQTWNEWRTFELCISPDHLRQVIMSLKQTYPDFAISNDPGDYQVTHMSFLAELFTPRDDTSIAELGTAIRKVQLFAVKR